MTVMVMVGHLFKARALLLFAVVSAVPGNAQADTLELMRLFRSSREPAQASEPQRPQDIIETGSTTSYEIALRDAVQECSRRGFHTCTEFNRTQIRRFIGDPRDNVVVTEFHVSVRGEMMDSSGGSVCGDGSAESSARRLVAALGGTVSSGTRDLLLKFCNQELEADGILKLAREVAQIAEKQRRKNITRYLAARGLEELLQKTAQKTSSAVN